MRLALAMAGVLVILAAICFRAVKKLTVDLTAMWGLLGIFLVLAGMLTPLSDWIRECIAETGRAAAVFGTVCILAGFQFSLVLSRLAMKNQDLAIEVALLKQENERILEEFKKRSETVKNKMKKTEEYRVKKFFADR